MKLIEAKIYLDTLRKYEHKMGTNELRKILGHWFGGVAEDVILQALDNYREGLESPVYDLEIEVNNGAMESIKSKGIKIPRKHGFFSRLRYLMFG